MGSTPQEYWGLLIDPEHKRPTPRLDSLLSGIAHYIIKNLEPREHHVLTPEKLAAFYRSVGGNYDSLFLETSPASLSFVYQALGCYHSLQPVADPFAPPVIPALTASGFKRWATIQLLLQPDEQVPLLQAAVRIYDINNRVDGHVFPKILPAECLPRRPDPQMVAWHDDSLQKLKLEAEQEAARAHRPPMARVLSGTPLEDDSSGSEDAGYFSLAKWKGKVTSRWDQFRGDGRPISREDRMSRERDRDRDRRRRGGDDRMDGSYRSYQRPDMENNRRHSQPGHRVDGEYGRGSRARGFTQIDYDSPPSPVDTGYNARFRRPQYSAQASPLSPNMRGRDQDRGYGSAGPSPQEPTPHSNRPPISRSRPSAYKHGRRHSSHEPLSPSADVEEPQYPRARSRSHHGGSPKDHLAPSDAYNTKTARPTSTYIPAATTATAGIPAMAPPAFARGKLRHTVHSSGHSPYGVRPVDDCDGPRMSQGVRYMPADGDDPRMNQGVRYMPAADDPRRVDRSRDYVGA